MNTRKLTAAAAVLLAAAALSGCGPDDTEQRVATVRASIEAQIKDGRPLPMNGLDR